MDHRLTKELEEPFTEEEILELGAEKDLSGVDRFFFTVQDGEQRIGLNPTKYPLKGNKGERERKKSARN